MRIIVKIQNHSQAVKVKMGGWINDERLRETTIQWSSIGLLQHEQAGHGRSAFRSKWIPLSPSVRRRFVATLFFDSSDGTCTEYRLFKQ